MPKPKKKKVLPADPAQELADAQTALDAMRQNLQLATAQIAEKGLLVTTQISDSHGKFTTVDRINPAIKVQREALRTITVLKRQIEQLQKDVQAKTKPLTALDVLAAMKKEKESQQ
jgi:hypothetical protein